MYHNGRVLSVKKEQVKRNSLTEEMHESRVHAPIRIPEPLRLLHTPGHINCIACTKAASMIVVPLRADMSFTEVAARFLESITGPESMTHIRYVRKNTLIDYRKKLKALGIFFSQLRMQEIHIGHIVEYQRARAEGTGYTRMLGKVEVVSPAGAGKINAEMSLLRRLMLLAGAWTPEIEKFYRPYQVPDNDVQRALSAEEQENFLQVAASRPEWHVVWWYSLVGAHTTFSSDEMRTIRQGDINLTHQVLSVNRRFGKNTYRRRDIPICDGACVWAMERLLDRAAALGGRGPHLYLFPARVCRNHFTGEQHMSETGIRKQFEEVRAAAGVPWFQLNGWRHTAITRMAEAGVPIATIMARAGHMTYKMSAHYTHISDQVQRQAMRSIYEKKPVMSVQAYELRRKMG